MAKNKDNRKWWLSGRLGLRLVLLGICLGVIGAVLFTALVLVGHVNPSTMVWSLFFLLLEVPVGGGLGLAVSGAVLLVRRFLPPGLQRDTNAAILGLTAFSVQSVLIFALFSIFPWGGIPGWAAAVVTGPIIGSIYAMFIHARPDQLRNGLPVEGRNP